MVQIYLIVCTKKRLKNRLYILKERITATQKSQSKGILIGLYFICKKIQCFADILARFIFIYTLFLLFGLIICAVSSLIDRILILSTAYERVKI